MGLIELLITFIVLVGCFYIFDRYIVPVIPAPWGKIAEAIFALIVIIYLLARVFGIRL